MKWFNKQSRLVQLLLLLVPIVNWFTEVIVRWTAFIDKPGIIRLLVALLVTFIGIVWGWIDLIWVLLFNHLIFAKSN